MIAASDLTADEQDSWAERASIIQYGSHVSREESERMATACILRQRDWAARTAETLRAERTKGRR